MEWWGWALMVIVGLGGFQFGVKKEGGRWLWDTIRSPLKPE